MLGGFGYWVQAAILVTSPCAFCTHFSCFVALSRPGTFVAAGATVGTWIFTFGVVTPVATVVARVHAALVAGDHLGARDRAEVSAHAVDEARRVRVGRGVVVNQRRGELGCTLVPRLRVLAVHPVDGEQQRGCEHRGREPDQQ